MADLNSAKKIVLWKFVFFGIVTDIIGVFVIVPQFGGGGTLTVQQYIPFAIYNVLIGLSIYFFAARRKKGSIV